MAFEYKVVELREGVIGGKMSGDKLEKVLNEHGRQGWQLKSVTAVEVKGPRSGWGRGSSRDIRTDDGLTATRRSGALGAPTPPTDRRVGRLQTGLLNFGRNRSTREGVWVVHTRRRVGFR